MSISKHFARVAMLLLICPSLCLAQTKNEVEGTFWAGVDANGAPFVLEFQQSGRLLYIPSTSTISKGTWKQSGDAIEMETNRGFATFTCTIDDNRLKGSASNKRGFKWSWSATKQPVVSSTVSPIYPPLARAARIAGSVIVDAEVDAAGIVTGIRSVIGHPLLRAASERAARDWRFQPTAEANIRVARLIFVFSMRDNEKDEKVASTVFLSPYRTEIRRGVSLIERYIAAMDTP